ncbi:MAG TPA: aminoglycoside phosphotransferase family protein [Gaiellaceae bacterium]
MAFPSAQGARVPWEAVPLSVREAVESGLGSPVAQAVTRPGGFSPGAASRLRLEDGRRVFVKAVGSQPNPDSPDLHRDEARVTAALPPETPAPKLLFSHDDGDWVALVFEDVDGREPDLPWRRDDLDRILDALNDLVVALTPAPIEAETFAERFGDVLHGWRTLAAEPAGDLDHWTAERLDLLAELEAGWEQAGAGETLLHADVRADNVLLTSDRVVFVDWPHASLGAPWVDLVAFLPSVAMQGGPKPWELFDDHALAREAIREDVDAVLAAVTGFFIHRSTFPPPPGLPTLREFQRAQGVEALAWLRRRLES